MAVTTSQRAGLWVLFAVACAAVVLHAAEAMRSGVAQAPFFARPALEVDGYPLVGGFRVEVERGSADLELGDRLIRAGEHDLRGLGFIGVSARVLEAARPRGDVWITPLEIERGGERRTLELELEAFAISWFRLPFLIGMLLVSALLLPRVTPDSARALVAFLLIVIAEALFLGGPVWKTVLARITFIVAGVAGFALAADWARIFPPELPEQARLSRRWVAAIAAIWLLPRLLYLTGLGPASPWIPALELACDALMLGGILMIATRNYRASDPIGRRRLRWILYTLYIPGLPMVVVMVAGVLVPNLSWFEEGLALAGVLGGTLPLGLAVALTRFEIFDIDRWITSTAAYSLLVVAGLATALALVPPVARAAADGLGIDGQVMQLVLSVGVAALVVPLQRELRPWLERRFFPERRALDEGMSGLLARLDACADPKQVLDCLGERLVQLVSPTRALLLARDGNALSPASTHRLDEAPELELHSPLLIALEGRTGASRLAELEFPAETSGAWDRAQLERAGLELLLPVRRDGELAALLALGPKASGDVYTSTDVALLGAVGERASVELRRFRDAQLIEQGREMVEALQRDKEQIELEHLSRSRSLAAASHDLRQPLHALGLFVEALEGRVDDGESRALLDKIRASTDALGGMFEGMLDLSRLETGQTPVQVVDVEIGPLFERLRAEAEPDAERRGLRLRVVPRDARVRSDPILLGRILQNLLTNAIRYTGEGGVLLAARKRGDEIALQVRDTGPGIPEARQREIFEAFVRLEDRAGMAPEGLGLGLSIVDRLARLLGHPLELRSVVGRGSCFTLRVPIARGPARPEAAAPALPGSDLTGRRVAVLDDDPGVLEAMRALLEGWGIEVCTAGATDELLGQLNAFAAEVVVSDWDLGADGTGADALEAVAEAVGRELPAALITGDGDREHLRALRERGWPVLTKPVAPARLRAVLNRLLE